MITPFNFSLMKGRVLIFMGGIIPYTKKDIYHNSLLNRFRCPQGALVQGTSLTLRVEISKKLSGCFVMACLYSDGWSTTVLLERASERLLEAVIKMPQQVGLVHYYFIINDKSTLYYYGAYSGEGVLWNSPVEGYQITLFDKGFKTPDWYKNAIMYQIFPDRFYRSSDSKPLLEERKDHEKDGRQKYWHNDWKKDPIYAPLWGNPYYDPCDYYGGNLKGIEEKLDYIASLGVSVLYLNPIFEAHSNHRYNTSDYLSIDPILGTNEDFLSLCKSAEQKGIKLILDGVFSHTGDDSLYFDKYGRYGNSGAYQSPDSPYFGWYSFDIYPWTYKSWWGFKTLPEVNEMNSSFKKFIVTGTNSVVKKYIREGAYGWRLDVADELPDEFIAQIRKAMKEVNPDSVLLGEVWDEASTKFSMNTKRKYVMGSELDSVMNYPLRDSIISFLLRRIDSKEFIRRTLILQQNYPQEFFYACMNLISSHDMPRALSILGGAPDKDSGASREQQATYKLEDAQIALALKRIRLATLLQFSMPGVPSIYYGDEAQAEGLMDPFNRKTFKWGEENEQLTQYFKKLAELRNSHAALRTGYMALMAPHSDVIAAIRLCNGTDAFGNEQSCQRFIALVNSSKEDISLELDFSKPIEGVHGHLVSGMDGRYACCLSEEIYDCIGGLIKIKMPALSGILIKSIL